MAAATRTIIRYAQVITPYRELGEQTVVAVAGGKIAAIYEKGEYKEQNGDRMIDAQGFYLSPGFIDLHTHGAGNADLMDGSIEAVCTVCRTHMHYGTTSLLPTTLSSSDDELFANLANIGKAARIRKDMPEILGVHLEGPYFSPEQSAAQDPRYIRNPLPEDYQRIFAHCPSIRIWSAAPELPGALEFGRWMRQNGIIGSIGHSNAVYEEVAAARENGYSMVTHLFNGMSRLTRKNAVMYPGVSESALYFDDLAVEIIADGKHLPPSLLKMIYKIKGAERICLVTDSMRAAGLDVKESIIGSLANGQRVEIEDGVAYMPGRKSFGGSVSTADRLVRTMRHLAEVPLSDAVKMMTSVPARLLHVDDRKGSITVGKDADLILFDQDIRIKLVMCNGKVWLDQR